MSAKTQVTGRLIELFSAIQGEGLNVGIRQLFIRLALCDLRCHFCDSANTWEVPHLVSVEQTPGNRDFQAHPNPVTCEQLLAWVERQNYPGLHDSISITGGEPLLQTPFLKEFLPRVRQQTGLPIYLETGGHRPQQLAQLLPYLNTIGMDIKLPSVSGEECWQSHQEFLALCRHSDVQVFVKLIISQTTQPTELELAAKVIAACNPSIPVFLQPVTPLPTPHHSPVMPPTPNQVLQWQALMKHQLQSVRVVPQTHKLIGQL